MRKIIRYIKQHILPFYCDECGEWSLQNHISVHHFYGDIWCEKCYKKHLGVDKGDFHSQITSKIEIDAEDVRDECRDFNKENGIINL